MEARRDLELWALEQDPYMKGALAKLISFKYGLPPVDLQIVLNALDFRVCITCGKQLLGSECYCVNQELA